MHGSKRDIKISVFGRNITANWSHLSIQKENDWHRNFMDLLSLHFAAARRILQVKESLSEPQLCSESPLQSVQHFPIILL